MSTGSVVRSDVKFEAFLLMFRIALCLVTTLVVRKNDKNGSKTQFKNKFGS